MSLNPQSLTPGQEQYETYAHPVRRGKKLCQCNYRHTDGTLFSCVAPTLGACWAKRDEWIKGREA